MLFRCRRPFAVDKGHRFNAQILRYTASGSNLRNDIYIHPTGPGQSRGRNSAYAVDGSSEASGFGLVAALYLAEGAGRLGLLSPDPGIQPDLDYNYLESDFDRSRMREAVRLCIEIAQQRGLAEIVESCIDPTAADLKSGDTLDEWLLRNARTSQHISGTCKMGPASDLTAVVDQFGKVHGLEGVRVADASIMPDCIRANTNATCMAIGERIADFVKNGE
jgi:choline dehydrogenase